MSKSLDDALKIATEEQNSSLTDSEETTEAEETEETEEAEETEEVEGSAAEEEETEEGETEDSNEGLTPDQVNRAKKFYKTLMDPQQGRQVLRAMAERAGLLTAETKQEVKEAKKDFISLLKDRLGEQASNYDHLFPLLQEVSSHFEGSLQEVVEDLRNEILLDRQERMKESFWGNYNRFLTINKVTEVEAGVMARVMEDIPPSPGVDLQKYLSRLLKNARNDIKEAADQKQIKNRQTTNLGKRVKTLSGGGEPEIPLTKGGKPKTMDLDEAIQAALADSRVRRKG